MHLNQLFHSSMGYGAQKNISKIDWHKQSSTRFRNFIGLIEPLPQFMKDTQQNMPMISIEEQAGGEISKKLAKKLIQKLGEKLVEIEERLHDDLNFNQINLKEQIVKTNVKFDRLQRLTRKK